jgi:putative SOS response-associated peptidase YedK
MSWGFTNFNTNAPVINARAETAGRIKMFAKSMQHYRCVIPSTGFYEWAREEADGKTIKRKYILNLKGENMVYMAGMYNSDNKFVILTTKANESMEKIHSRMPVIVEKKYLRNWIFDSGFAMNMIKQTPPEMIWKTV